MVNTITFGGVTSSTYDIYISGEGVWSAPERDAEVITIPGRNGAFVQDNGRFQNITVTYPAFIVKDNNTNFKTKIDGFRNAMASKVGYQRLVDTYHTDEYRMAAFIGGMEVEPILYNDHAATFDLVFECKPQRFLTSGETAVSVANNGTITNPTLYPSGPLLEVVGYGDMTLGSDTISIIQNDIGNITVAPTHTENYSHPVGSIVTMSVDVSAMNTADTFTISGLNIESGYSAKNGRTIDNIAMVTKTNCSGYYIQYSQAQGSNGTMHITANPITFSKGTSASTTFSVIYDAYLDPSPTISGETCSVIVAYDGASTVTMTLNNTLNSSYLGTGFPHIQWPKVVGYSTKQTTGNPMYIDLDIGEAWNEDYGTPVSVNNAVTLPANLPVLPPGSTTITYDNTITSFKIVPRWWQV